MDEIQKKIAELTARLDAFAHEFMQLGKQVDDVMLFHRLEDVAFVDKVRYTGPPPANPAAQTPQDRGNRLKVHAYTFVPKDVECGKKYPMLVLVHGGVHSNFSSSHVHIVRELVSQGYLVIAPDYRGSTGYGEQFYKFIDYGGLEVEDAFEARNWMVENIPLVDAARIGIMGWSHGGLITLMNIFNHPDSYRAAFAGVPVSDLVARMGYKGDDYRALFSADYHIGKTAFENPWEYRRRSPAWNAEKLQTPLLVHTTTNDEDVNVLEVEHLIKALKAAGKEFQYKIHKDAPGAHMFESIDTTYAQESRKEVYKFLAQYLNPPKPLA
jgi:dipeptidyl aminopeptidase/acylaminoacyl peptidase